MVLIAASCMTAAPAIFAQGAKAVKRTTVVAPPRWFKTLPSDTINLMACGRAEAKDQQLAIDRAVFAARNDIGLTLRNRWKQLLQEIRIEGIPAEGPAWEPFILKGSKTKMQQAVRRRKTWTAFVLVTLPKSSVPTLLLEKARSDPRWYELVKNTRAVTQLSTFPR